MRRHPRARVIVIPPSDHLAELVASPDCRVRVGVTGTLVCMFLLLLKFIRLMGDKSVVPIDQFLVALSLGFLGGREEERRA